MNPPLAPPVLQPASTGRRTAKAAALIVAVALATMLVMLFCFDPARHRLYPQCMLKRVTGWDCPGCGGLRATHQLMHGNVRAAFALNPMLFVLGPVVAWWLAAEAARHSGRRWRSPFDTRAGVVVFVAAVVLFGILRNFLRLSP